MKPTFSILIHCLVGHLNMPLVQACPQALGAKNTNVALTAGKHRDHTGSCRYSHQCHTINIYIQCRLFSWAKENWLGKTGKKIPSLISCYSDFHMEQLRGYLHVLAYWEHTKRLHYIQECCLVCKPGNHSLLAYPAAELERGREALSLRALWKCNSGNLVYYAHTKQAHCTPISSLLMALHCVMETVVPLKMSGELHPPVLLKIALLRKVLCCLIF